MSELHIPFDPKKSTTNILIERGMTWTSEKPTVPEWYWYRGYGDADRVVHVMDNGENLVACSFEFSEAVQYLDGLWAGPLICPSAQREG